MKSSIHQHTKGLKMHTVPIDFDFISYHPKIKNAQNLYEYIEQSFVENQGHDQELCLTPEFEAEYQKRGYAVGNGVAIINIKSAQIMNKFIGFIKLGRPLDFQAADSQSCDLVGVIISPAYHGGLHLRRLSRLSRLLKEKSFVSKLRDAENEDVLTILLKEYDSFIENEAA